MTEHRGVAGTPPAEQGGARPWARALSRRVIIVCLLVGLLPAFFGAGLAAFVMCGISGCGGGGFGRSTDADGTIMVLAATGAASAGPLLLYALVRRSLRLALVSCLYAVLVTLTAGFLIGSDFSGCPRRLDAATCAAEDPDTRRSLTR